jgi:hypothetical protein
MVADKHGAEGDAAGVVTVSQMPQDPVNPLDAAYDLKAYEIFARFRRRVGRTLSKVAQDEPEWDHLGYLRRSPSPCRLRTNGPMYPTRKGAWRSRAGGVYLPPEEPNPEDRGGSPSPSPARWVYPEEFTKRERKEFRRSPSYTRVTRSLSSPRSASVRSSSSASSTSSSSSSSSSSTPTPRPKRRKKQNSSRRMSQPRKEHPSKHRKKSRSSSRRKQRCSRSPEKACNLSDGEIDEHKPEEQEEEMISFKEMFRKMQERPKP